MPFTLAHPLIVLPFARCRYLHFPALFIGAMSPDFLYFLAGKPVSGGHQLLGSEPLNLSLTLLVYWLYQAVLRPDLQRYLPHFLNMDFPRAIYPNHWVASAVFLYSAWLGMASHILWDDFTHVSGYFVQQFPLLRTVYLLPIYKWLQYSSGVLGLLGIGLFWLWNARKFPHHSACSVWQKTAYWLAVFAVMGAVYTLWRHYSPLAFTVYARYAEVTIRLVDSLLLSLCICNLSLRLFAKNRAF